MANIGFTNAKVALAFAGMTILGALAMVGTPDNEGVLGQITSRVSEDRSDADGENGTSVRAQSVSTAAPAPAPGWASPATVNADSDVPPAGAVIETPRPAFAPAPPAYSDDPATAPLSPGAIVTEDEDEE